MEAPDLHGPAAPPPGDMKPNFHNPPNANAASVALILLCLVIATVFTALRIWSRVLMARKLVVADALGFSAFGFYVGNIWCGLDLWKKVGFFTQQYNVRLGAYLDALYPIYLSPLFLLFFMMCIKTAILLDWLHVFVPAGTRNAFFWTCWAMIVVNNLFNGAVVVALQFHCTPVEKNWNRLIPGTCNDRTYIDRIPALFNLCLDIIILVLPQRVIWTLHMNTRRKVGISIIFSVGLMACACATARIAYAWNIDYRAKCRLRHCALVSLRAE